MDGFLAEQKDAIASNKATLSKVAGTEDAGGGSEEEESNPFSSLLDTVKPLVSALGIFGDMIMGMNPLVAVLKPILEGFVSIMAPALKTVLAPIMDALSWIGESLAMVLIPILDAIYPAFAVVGNIIMTAVTPALQMLSPVVELIAGIFKAMTPIIVLLGKAFTVIISPVQFVADLFSWLGKWLSYLGQCVAVCAWNLTHWFSQKSYPDSPGGFSSDAFTGLGDKLALWDAIGDQNSVVSDSVSTGTAVSSASYQGATQVTINIYQEAPVVGDGGMRQFAQMIREEFSALDYYGVTV